MDYEMATEFIKKERESQGLTQEQLAERANISLRTVSAIESQEKVRQSSIEKAAAALGYNLKLQFVFEKIIRE